MPVIAIANQKGGVGKTTTAVNLGAGLALRFRYSDTQDRKVLVIDTDPQMHALMALAFGNYTAPGPESLAALLTQMPAPSVQGMLRISEYHPNLHFIPGNRAALTEAAGRLPGLMNKDMRLSLAIESIRKDYAFIIIDTPPNPGDLLTNTLVASTHVLIPVETSYLGVTGLQSLHQTIENVRMAYQRSDLEILGYLPTMVDVQRAETGEILESLSARFGKLVLEPIHKSADLAYAHSAHMDIFNYKPPRRREDGALRSSSRGTKDYAQLVENVLKRTAYVRLGV
jgi:chromosome partitioning protein